MESEGTTNNQAMSLTIDRLAELTNLRVDTIRYYQTKGLIPPPSRQGRGAYYHRHHLDRLTELKELRERGWSLQAIAQQFRDELQPKPITVSERTAWLLNGDFSVEELGALTKIPTPLLSGLISEGLLSPLTTNPPTYSHADVRLGKLGLELLSHHVAFGPLMALATQFARACQPIIDEAVELFDSAIDQCRREDESPQDAAQRSIAEFDELFELVTELVSLYFERNLAARALSQLRQYGTPEEQALVHQRLTGGDQ